MEAEDQQELMILFSTSEMRIEDTRSGSLSKELIFKPQHSEWNILLVQLLLNNLKGLTVFDRSRFYSRESQYSH